MDDMQRQGALILLAVSVALALQSHPLPPPTANTAAAAAAPFLSAPSEGEGRWTREALAMDPRNRSAPWAPFGSPSFRPRFEDCGTEAFLRRHGGRGGSTSVVEALPFESLGFEGVRRGMLSTSRVERERDVMFIPQAVMMSTQTAGRSYRGKLARFFVRAQHLPAAQQVEQTSLLALHVMHEALQRRSFWGPYLCSLPAAAPQPFLWGREAIRAACVTWAAAGVFRSQKICAQSVDEKFEEYRGHYSDLRVAWRSATGTALPGDYTLSAFVWAYGMVDSRSFGWKKDDGAPDVVMMPYADMVNSREKGAGLLATFYESEHGVFGAAFRAMAPADSQQELFLHYGDNHCHATQYGFADAETKCN